jgi:hypothetical protein
MKNRGTSVFLVLVAVGSAAPAWAIPPDTDDAPHNSLETTAVNDPALAANRELRHWLAQNPLTSLAQFVSQYPEYSDQVSASEDLLRYITTCALDSTHDAPVTLPDGAVLTGQIGLCGPASPYSAPPYGDWSQSAPSPECLSVVSACVLALVNAAGARVPVSLRGWVDPQSTPLTPLLGLRPKILVEQQLRDKTDIDSVHQPCDPSNDKTANCGWTSLSVGRCETRLPTMVENGLNAPSRAVRLTLSQGGQPVTNVKLRVCRGMYACDFAMCQTNPHLPACHYAGHIKSVADGTGQITFQCPANGPEMNEEADTTHPSHKYGYYSVMIAPMTSQPLDANYDIHALPEVALQYDGTGYEKYAHYQANEREVFTYREGAFYGDLFADVYHSPNSPDPALRLRGYTRSRDYDGFRPPIFSCWADAMMSPYIAFMDERWCAIDTNECFIGAPPSTCHDQSPWECDYAGNFWRGEFTLCTPITSEPPWKHPLTTYLNGPCDLARDDCYDNPTRNVTAVPPGAALTSAPAPAGLLSPMR